MKDRQYNGQTKKDKRTQRSTKTLHGKLKIEQHKIHKKPVMNSGASEGLEFAIPHVAPVELLLLQTMSVSDHTNIGNNQSTVKPILVAISIKE